MHGTLSPDQQTPRSTVEQEDRVPRRGNWLTRTVARTLLRLSGWRIGDDFPNLPRFIAIAAPHTSNWDFFFGYSAIVALNIKVQWVGKHTLFKWPWGGLMRWFGGVPINRSKTEGAVEQMVAIMNSHEKFIIGLTPEGTRSRTSRWRTGFYHVAHQTGVPIVLCYFDYSRRIVGIGPTFEPTGDFEADMVEILSFYADKVPRRPALFTGNVDSTK